MRDERKKRKHRRWPLLFIGIALGLGLGVSASFFLRAPNSPFSAKFLDWPFLTSILLVCFVAIFFDSLEALIGRGEFTIAWSKDHSIKVRDLSTAIDEELEPIRDDIDFLQKALTELQKGSGIGASSTGVLEFSGEVTGIESLAPLNSPRDTGDRDARLQRLREALSHSKFKWRKVESLAAATALTEKEVLDLILTQDDIRLSLGKSGRQIAGLISRVGEGK